MATSFPTGLDTFVDPTPTNPMTSPSHSAQHSNANDALTAVEAKVGINNSSVNTSLDYVVGQSAPGVANRVRLFGAASGSGVIVQPDGADTNIVLTVSGKGNGTVRATAASASAVGLTVRGAASQTADLQEWQNSAGTNLVLIGAGGLLQVGAGAGYGTTTGLLVSPNLTGTAFDRASQIAPVQTGSPSTNSVLLYVVPTVNTGLTVPAQFGILVGSVQPTSGHGTVTGYAGMCIGDSLPFGGTNNTLLLMGQLAIPTGNYGVYDASGYASYFAGSVTAVGGLAVGGGNAAAARVVTVKAASGQTANVEEWQDNSGTSFVAIGPPTLPTDGSKNFLSVTGTLPSALSATDGVSINITSAGSSVTERALHVQLQAGYTGTSSAQAFSADCYTAAPANTLSGLGSGSAAGNYAAVNGSRGTGASGANVGCFAWGGNALRNVGVQADATLGQNNSASALSIGLLAYALRANSSAVEIGGYFGLQSAEPTFASAALIADNGGETVPVFLARVSGTTMFSVTANGSTNSGAGQIVHRTGASDMVTNYMVDPKDYIIAYPAVTIAHTVTLPAASGNPGQVFVIKDESGAVTSINSITVSVTSGGRIDGVFNKVLNTAYQALRVYSNGTDYFTF